MNTALQAIRKYLEEPNTSPQMSVVAPRVTKFATFHQSLSRGTQLRGAGFHGTVSGSDGDFTKFEGKGRILVGDILRSSEGRSFYVVRVRGLQAELVVL